MRRSVALRTPGGETISCELADTATRRFLGLMGRREPPPGGGLLLVPCRSVHTAFMRFAVDVVFLAPRGEVLRVAARTPPWRLRLAPRRTRIVLELGGGEAARVSLAPGARLEPTDPASRRAIAGTRRWSRPGRTVEPEF